jgi:NAD(P)-dependent dehydrogenase (short-subunit alcohol dehydrogenase family)
VVTGAGGGLGSAISELFAAEGAHVLVNDVRADAAAQTVERCQSVGGRAEAVIGDVSQASDVAAMFDHASRVAGRVNVLVNNAGVSTATDPEISTVRSPLERDIRDVTEASWNRMLAIHLTGTFLCTRAAVELMAPAGSGSIVCMSSMAATAGMGAVHYAAAKAGILGLVRSQARSLGPLGIRINAVCPGSIDAGMLRNFPRARVEEGISQTPLRRLGTAAEVAFAVLHLASFESGFTTGQYLSPNGGRVIT